MTNVHTDLWLKTHIWRDGHRLVATVGTVDGLDARMFEVSVDLRPIAKAVQAYHQRLHDQVSGCVGCDQVGLWGLGKAIKKIGKSKLLRKVSHAATMPIKLGLKYSPPALAYRAGKNLASDTAHGRLSVKKAFSYTPGGLTLKDAAGRAKLSAKYLEKGVSAVPGGKKLKATVKSPYFGAASGALSIAFPPIGVPALAAYASANLALESAEKGRNVYQNLKKLTGAAKWLGALKKSAKGKTKLQFAAELRAKGLTGRVKMSIDAKRALKRLQKGTSAAAFRKMLAQRKKSLKVMKNISAASRGSDPVKRAQAQKAAAVMVAVANARKRLEAIQGAKGEAHAGVLITTSGPKKGIFRPTLAKTGTSPDLLMLANGNKAGTFEKIGGCIGCGLFAL
jgi:hypothetical protein